MHYIYVMSGVVLNDRSTAILMPSARLGGVLILRGYRDVGTNLNTSVKSKQNFELTLTTMIMIK